MRFTTIILSAVLLISFLGCDTVDNGGDPATGKLESRVNFKIYESFQDNKSGDAPQIYISLNSEKIYPCMNYSYSVNAVESGGSIEMYLSGIIKPNICLTALGPATYRQQLNFNEGLHELNFYAAGFSDRYVVFVSDSSIVVSGNSTDNTKPVYTLYWRHPKHSFVYTCGTLTEDSSLAYDFLDTLKSHLNIKEFKFPNVGEIPYPKSSGGYYYNMPAKYFTYSDESEFSKAGELLTKFTRQVLKDKGGAGITLSNWLNVNYYSWMLN